MRSSLPLLALLTAFGGGCGGPTSNADYGEAHVEPTRAPFDVPLLDANNEPVELSEMRGQFVLLFLFATFDLPSQAALEPLREVAGQHPEMKVIGVALQPNPRDLLQIFATALELDFPLTYDPENRLLQGLTDLGRVDSVPTYVLLDRDGFIAKASTTPMNAGALRQWCGFD